MPRPPKDIKKLSHKLLKDLKEPPVPVVEIAKKHDIKVVYKSFENEPSLSGILVRRQDETIMGINQFQSENRQRFTIAHELGHFFLDPEKDVWVDKGIGSGSTQISYRRSSGFNQYQVQEVRANKFAAALLMPEEWVRSDFEKEQKNNDWKGEEDELARKLARRYEVSMQAMIIRLLELELLKS